MSFLATALVSLCKTLVTLIGSVVAECLRAPNSNAGVPDQQSVDFVSLCELTRSAIYGSQKFDSLKWPTVLFDEVKGKPCNFQANSCGSLYSTFTSSFYP